MRSRFFELGVVTAFFVATTAMASAQTLTVTNAANSGPGSLRNAVRRANNNSSITQIRFDFKNRGRNFFPTINLTGGGLAFTGKQDLELRGNTGDRGTGPVIRVVSKQGEPLFRATGGGDLSVHNLIFRSSGQGNGESGLVVKIPNGATGQVSVTLHNSSFKGFAGFGVQIDDDTGGGSAAGVLVDALNCAFENNGIDGLKVDEGGNGDVDMTLDNVLASNNGDDGVQIDESGRGHVTITVLNTVTSQNGDTGLQVDEVNGGLVRVDIDNAVALNNGDDGFDFEENQAGNFVASIRRFRARGNGDDGLELIERDRDSMNAQVMAARLVNNPDDGADVIETGPGNAGVTFSGGLIQGNGDFGIDLPTSPGAGTHILTVSGANLSGNSSGNVGGAGAGSWTVN